MRHAASSPHEIMAWLTYADHGLSPYWTLSKFIRGFNGGVSTLPVELPTGPAGAPETGNVSFGYHVGNLKPRPSDSRDPSKGMWELNLRWTGRGQRKASFQIKPRWHDMQHVESGDAISTPFDHADQDEGVAIFVQGSNLEPDEYPIVLRESCRALAQELGEHWSTRYFKNPLPAPLSQILAHERYFRVHRKYTDDVAGLGGLFGKLQQLYSNQEGTHVQLDINNKEIKGFQNRVWLPHHSIDAIPGLEHGCKLEWYHPKEVRGQERLDDGDSLAHPKFEALYMQGGQDNPRLNQNPVPWSQRHDLVRNLEEFLVNTLTWSGVPIGPDPTVFVPDQHFEPIESERRIELHDDPTPEMEVSRHSALVRTLAEAQGRDLATLQALVTDGGRTHVTDLADDVGSERTVYRALEQLNDLVENENGVVSFVCQKIHEDLQEVFSIADAGKASIEYAHRATERLLQMSEDALEHAGASLRKWATKYGVQLDEREAGPDRRQLIVKIDSMLSRHAHAQDVPQLSEVLDLGYSAWRDVGRDPQTFRKAIVEYRERLTNDVTRMKVSRALR